jgi:hypothetical protein
VPQHFEPTELRSTGSVDPWALNNAAHIYLQNQDFVAAKDLAELAIESADMLQAPRAQEIKTKSASIAALAAEQLGDTDAGLIFRQIGKEKWDDSVHKLRPARSHGRRGSVHGVRAAERVAACERHRPPHHHRLCPYAQGSVGSSPTKSTHGRTTTTTGATRSG